MPQTAAQRERARRTRARNRFEGPKNYWRRPVDPLSFGREEFRVWGIRGNSRAGGKPRVKLDPLVTSIEWRDDESILKGSVTISHPKHKLDLNEGHQIALEVSPHGGQRFKELWRMRIAKPVYSAANGDMTFELQSDLALLQKSKDDFKYKKDKKHPRGWLVHDIVRDVCRRYGVKVGRLAKTKHRVKNLTQQNASPLDIIIKAYERERTQEGRTFIIDYTRGKLEVLPFRRSRTMLFLGPTLLDAQYSRSLKEGFATVLTVRSTKSVSTGRRKKKKVKITVPANPRRDKHVQRYGYIHQKFTAKDADTLAEVKKEAQRHLLKMRKQDKELTLSHPGITSVKRGQAIKVYVPEVDLQSICFIKSVSHSVAAGNYAMELTIAWKDPYEDAERRRKKALKKRRDAARRRNRNGPRGGDDNRNRNREDRPGREENRRES